MPNGLAAQTSFARFKLGKQPRKYDPRTLRLANYLAPLPENQPKPRASVNWSKAVPTWPMLRNDEVGDCTVVSALHMLQCWNENAGRDYEVTDEQALEAYSRICGYVPGDPSTDNGGAMLDVLKAWTHDGIGGKKILAFMSVNRRDRCDIKLAVDYFGGIYAGAMLPKSAETQRYWKVTSGRNAEPGSWGGHAINITDYNRNSLTCVTWGALLKMSWLWFDRYVDEAYCVVTEDWLDANKRTPHGFDLTRLRQDLEIVSR